MDLFVIFIAIAIGGFCVMACKKNTKTIFNYGSYFCLIWTVVIIFSNSGIYGFYLPSGLVNFSMIIGVAIFGCVYCSRAPREKYISYEYEYVSDINKKLIIICNIIAFAFMVPIFIKALAVISSSGYTYLRSIAGIGSQELGTSSMKDLALQAFCYPLTIASLVIGIRKLFLREKEATVIVALSAVNLSIYCIANAARNGFVVAIILVVLTLADEKRKKATNANRPVKLGFWQKIFIFIIVFAAIYAVVYISGQRASYSKSLLENIYLYFFAGPGFFTKLIEEHPNYLYFDGNLWGGATFGFVYNLISLPLNYIGINIPNSDYIVNSVMASGSMAISPIARVNAMSTAYFSFIVDWGYLGIIIGPLILCCLSIYISKKRVFRNNIRWDAIGIYWFYYLYHTIFKHDGLSISFFFVFAFIFLFTRDKNEIIKQR